MIDGLAEPCLEHLVEAWQALPARQQALLWQYAVLGAADHEVADRLGITVAELPGLLERARLELGVRYREVAHAARSGLAGAER